MHLKSLFPSGSRKWLHDRREFRDFTNKCWYEFDNRETCEIFVTANRIVSLMYCLCIDTRHLLSSMPDLYPPTQRRQSHMHLKSLFSAERTKWLPAKWLPERRAFRDFANRCWNADTGKTREIFHAGDRIMSLMYWVFLRNPIFGAHYATRVSTHSTETKSHAS